MSQASDYNVNAETWAMRPSSSLSRPRVICSTLSGEELQGSVLSYYSFKQPAQCVLFRRAIHDTYLVSSGDRQFALKVYRANWRSGATVLHQLSIIQQLSAQGARVAQPLARADGNLITKVQAPEGLRTAVMFQWAKGVTPKFTEPIHAQRYGRSLAALHDVSDMVPCLEQVPQMDMDYIFINPLKRVRSQLNLLLLGTRRLDALADRIAKLLSCAGGELGDWGLCHGDVWASNASVDDDDVVMLDFDYCGAGWRLFDVASYRLEARLSGAEERAWPPFRDAYLETRVNAVRSFEFLGVFMILRYLWTVAETISLSTDRGIGFVPDEYYEGVMPFCERIESELITPRESSVLRV